MLAIAERLEQASPSPQFAGRGVTILANIVVPPNRSIGVEVLVDVDIALHERLEIAGFLPTRPKPGLEAKLQFCIVVDMVGVRKGCADNVSDLEPEGGPETTAWNKASRQRRRQVSACAISISFLGNFSCGRDSHCFRKRNKRGRRFW